ncbi:MAG: hypothetical protein M3O84_05645 [Actinomycetota bacterium]|nr:hypothetical protein [Actinomycetota bacterium]
MVALVWILATMAPAVAATHSDPDDVSGRLDIRQVTRTFTNGPAAPPMIHLQATTYDAWTLEQCARDDSCSFTFAVNALRVYWAVHRGPRGKIRQTCLIFRNETVIAKGVSTKDRRSVFCSFEKRLLRGDGPVRWRVQSFWTETLDKAPDTGWY